MLEVNRDICIDERELEEHFVRASGPGGQHVNKAATAVQLRFDAVHCSALGTELLQRLRRVAGDKMTVEGIVIIEAKRHRSQERNRADARARLRALLRQAAHRPKRRQPTKPSRAAKERRQEAKRRRGELKRLRRRVR